MIITELVPEGKQKINVSLDGEYAFFLYRKEVRRLELREGEEISEKLLADIKELILLPRAKNKALSLLKYGNRTKKEMQQRLIKAGYPPVITAPVISFLEEYRFIDDAAYVQSYIELHGSRKSRLKLQQELGMKGISKEMFAYAWQEQPEDTEEQALITLIEKRIRTKGAVTHENFQKYYGFFARKGYQSAMIVRLLKKYETQEDEFE